MKPTMTRGGSDLPGRGAAIVIAGALRVLALLVTAVAGFPALCVAAEATLTHDAYTSATNSNGNFGGATTLRVSAAERTWLRFDVASVLPTGTEGSDVAKAMLKLWPGTVNTLGRFDVYRVITAWTEGAVTDATAPLLGSVEAQGIQVVAASSFVTVDVTPLVRDWLDGAVNDGVALVRSPGSGISVRFDSKENTGAAREPRLEITLGGGGVPAGTMVFTDGGGCPTGYVMVSAYNGRFVVASDVPRVLGGSDTHTHGPGDYSGTSHTHSVPHNGWPMEPAGLGDGSRLAGNKASETEFMTIGPNTTGPGGGGSITGTSAAADSRPRFVTLTLCRKI